MDGRLFITEGAEGTEGGCGQRGTRGDLSGADVAGQRHEVLDRLHCVQVMLQELVVSHEALDAAPASVKERVDAAADAIAEAYQAVGAWGFATEDAEVAEVGEQQNSRAAEQQIETDAIRVGDRCWLKEPDDFLGMHKVYVWRESIDRGAALFCADVPWNDRQEYGAAGWFEPGQLTKVEPWRVYHRGAEGTEGKTS